MLKNTERLEKVLFQAGVFTIKSVALLGQKSASGNRLDPIYTRKYNSTKYNDRNELNVIRFNQNEYIVFGVNDFENKINEEIFISYPHMTSLTIFLDECYQLVNTNDMYTNNSVASKYQDVVIESDSFASGKKMIAVPAVWDGKDNSVKKGILLFLNSEDICIQLDITAVLSLCYIISNFNLSSSTQHLLNSGMLTEIDNKLQRLLDILDGRGSSMNHSFRTTSNTGGNISSSSQKKRGLFGNSNGNRKSPLGSGITTRQPIENNNHVEEVVEEEIIQPEEKPRKKLSMQNIMDTASEIEVEDLGPIEI